MIITFSRIASPTELAERKRISLACLIQAEPAREADTPSDIASKPESIPDDLLSYLKLIAETQSMPATDRYKKAHISPKRGKRFQDALLGRGLIEILKVHHGASRPVEDLRLTPAGRKVTGN